MLCSALFKRVGVSLSLVFYVAIHPTSVLPVGKSRNGPPQSMPFCPFHPHTRAGNSPSFFSYYFTTSVRIQLWFLFILFCHRPRPFSMHARAYRCTEWHSNVVCFTSSFRSSIEQFFFLPSFGQPTQSRTLPRIKPNSPRKKKIGENKNRINSQIISNAHRVFMVEFSALDKNKKNGYRLQLKLSSLIFDIYLWNI